MQEFITLDKPALLTDVGVGVWEKIVSGEVQYVWTRSYVLIFLFALSYVAYAPLRCDTLGGGVAKQSVRVCVLVICGSQAVPLHLLVGFHACGTMCVITYMCH